jgi:hypothetical protein
VRIVMADSDMRSSALQHKYVTATRLERAIKSDERQTGD